MFSAGECANLLRDLNQTPQSIQGTSAWCVQHMAQATAIVEVWTEVFARMSTEQRVSPNACARTLRVEAMLAEGPRRRLRHDTRVG